MYFRPDDCVPGKNATWRAVVEDYNRRGENEIRFWEAFKLYEPRQPYSDIYLNLQDFADRENHEFFIFSAGWGMVRSTYQLPYYEITFTRPESPEKRYVFRSKDRYQDFQHLTNPETSPIVIFAGQNYVEQLYSLMRGVGGRKLVFYFQSSNHNKKSYENGGEHGSEYLPLYHLFTCGIRPGFGTTNAQKISSRTRAFANGHLLQQTSAPRERISKSSGKICGHR